MPRFFNQIRKQLAKENKFFQYSRYAIGEILLVVIGILIALQVNNWNTVRIDRLSEADYLRRLTNDLARDTLNYTWTSNSMVVKQEALGSLLGYLNRDQLKEVDSSNLIKNIYLGRLLSFAQPDLITNTFEELKSTGNLKQIESTSLRTAITRYYSSRAHQYQRIEKKRKGTGYGDEVDRFIPGFERLDTIITYRTDLVSFKNILDHVSTDAFRRYAVAELNFAIFMHNIQVGGLEQSRELLKLIEDEMNQP